MKTMLFVGLLFACLLLANSPSQAQVGGEFPSEQQITILPPSVSSQLDCCVLPFSKIFVHRRTHVNWINESGGAVRLTIGKGTKCKEISGDSQVPYDVEGSLGCYVIPSLSKGKLSRAVQFSDPGGYDYTIEYLGSDNKPATAHITVF
jgi:hypothetical protein